MKTAYSALNGANRKSHEYAKDTIIPEKYGQKNERRITDEFSRNKDGGFFL